MNRATKFDLLIVYSERMAQSANSLSDTVIAPFAKNSGNDNYNLVYAYFLDTCRKNSLNAAFATSADIIGAGMCQSYWLFKNKSWMKVQETGSSNMIFDKFSSTSKRINESRKTLFSSGKIRPFNDRYLFELCFDKQKAYEKFTEFSIPTVTINDFSLSEVDRAIDKIKELIKKHKHKEDFSNDFVMKNRFGAGGINVYKFKINRKDKMIATMKKHKSISFILQPFVKFDRGFSLQGNPGSTDIRLIYIGQKIIQTYIRTAQAGNFKCNEHSGGTLKYISKNEVPSFITIISKHIAKTLNKNNSLFALDFIISNNGNGYFLEANSGPGLDWNLASKENEAQSKKLIRIIIKEVGRRIIN